MRVISRLLLMGICPNDYRFFNKNNEVLSASMAEKFIK